jgi:hypothetical protein
MQPRVNAACCLRHGPGLCLQFGAPQPPKPRAVVKFDALTVCSRHFGVQGPPGRRISTKAPSFHYSFWENVEGLGPIQMQAVLDSLRVNQVPRLVLTHSCGCGLDCMTPAHIVRKSQADNLIDKHFHYVLDYEHANNNANYAALMAAMQPSLNQLGLM